MQTNIQEFSNYHYYESMYANVQFNLGAKRLLGHQPC